MATDVERLVVSLSADIKRYERGMAQARSVMDASARQIEARAARMGISFDRIGARASTALAGIGAAFSVREVARYADAWTAAGNKIAAAAQLSGQRARSLEGIREIADNSRAGLTETADLYARLLRTVSASESDIARATEIVGKSFAASGASAQEAAAGVLQLGQALGSGLLQGDELRSLMENAPLLAEAIAREMGVAVGALKALGAEGRITSDIVFRAILSGGQRIGQAFDATNKTIAQGMTLVNNAMTEYVGQTDSGLGATARLTEGLALLADNFGAVADVVLRVAAVVGAAILGRAIGGMVAQLGFAGVAAMKFVAAVRAATTTAALATAIRAVGTAAGPLGALVGTVAATALMTYASMSREAATGSELVRERMAALEEQAGATAAAVEDSAARQAAAAREQIRVLEEAVEAAPDIVANTQQQMEGLLSMLRDEAWNWGIPDETLDTLDDLSTRAEEGELSAVELATALADLSDSRPDLSQWLAEFGRLATAAMNAVAAARMLREEAAAATTAQIVGTSAYPPDLGRFGNPYDRPTAQAPVTSPRPRRVPNNIDADLPPLPTGGSGGGGGGETKEDYAERAAAVREAAAALLAEASALDTAALSASAYGDVALYAQQRMELLVAAQRDGIAITPQLSAEIDGLARQYVAAAAAADEARDRHERFEAAVEQSRSTLEGAFSGLVTGALSLEEALGQVLAQLAQMAASRAFAGLWGMGLGGAVENGIAGSGLYDKGGYTGPGPRKQPAGIVHRGEVVWSQDDVRGAGGVGAVEALRHGAQERAPGFTGPGRRDAPAGVVHRGEVVWSQEDVRRAGGVGTVEAMRRGAKGYASGGTPGLTMPALAGPRQMRRRPEGGTGHSVSMTIDVRGAQGNAEIERLVSTSITAALGAYDTQLRPKIKETVSGSRKKWGKLR